jgi:hypothetical protein
VIAAHVEDLDTLIRKEEGEGDGDGDGNGDGDGVTRGADGVMDDEAKEGGAGKRGGGGGAKQGQRDKVTPL